MVSSSDAPLGAPFHPARSCILVVEDELLIRYMISDELRGAGYGVIEACNADEAVQILNSPAPIDLVISDVRMPGSMDGIGLLTVIKAAFPKLPVIIMSGHLEPQLATVSGATQFIAKPFALQNVLNAIRTALEK